MCPCIISTSVASVGLRTQVRVAPSNSWRKELLHLLHSSSLYLFLSSSIFVLPFYPAGLLKIQNVSAYMFVLPHTCTKIMHIQMCFYLTTIICNDLKVTYLWPWCPCILQRLLLHPHLPATQYAQKSQMWIMSRYSVFNDTTPIHEILKPATSGHCMLSQKLYMCNGWTGRLITIYLHICKNKECTSVCEMWRTLKVLTNYGLQVLLNKTKFQEAAKRCKGFIIKMAGIKIMASHTCGEL